MISVDEIIFISLSALSASFSLTVLLTGLLWPTTLLSKSRPFSTIVFFISLSDFCFSIMNCLGFPLNGTLQCSIQAFGVFYFPLSSWLWTVMLVYQLRTLIILKSLHISMSWIHVICWGIPLILSLLPLSTNPYGMDDFSNGNLTCDLSGSASTKLIWLDLCSTAAALMCFILMAIWSVEIYLHFRQAEDAAREMSFLSIMKLYPLALLITWLPRCLQALLVTVKLIPSNSSTVHSASYFFIISSQYGTLSALIYFSHSPASRLLWTNMLKRKFFQYLGIFTRNPSEISLRDDCSDVASNMEDVLVNRAMMGADTTSPLRESLSSSEQGQGQESLPVSIRESSTANNIMIQLAGSSSRQ